MGVDRCLLKIEVLEGVRLPAEAAGWVLRLVELGEHSHVAFVKAPRVPARLEVLGHALRLGRLGNDAGAELQGPLKKHGGGAHAVLGGQRGHLCAGEEGPAEGIQGALPLGVLAPEGGVGLDHDAVLGAVGAQLGLGQVRVQLHLRRERGGIEGCQR